MGGRLEGKVAVVTGGANGIGRACCVRFAQEGADVVVADLLEDPAVQTVGAVKEHGRDALFVPLDAASPADNDALARTALERFSRIDVVVTAAGISHAGYESGDIAGTEARLTEGLSRMGEPGSAIRNLDIDDWQQVLDVNLTGTMLALRALTAPMIDAGSGSVITLSSIAAKRPDAGPVAYCVSKAGVWMLTKAAARALAPAGIRVNALGPGYIDTNMTAAFQRRPPVRDFLIGQTPMGRFGQPEEIASAALFLASDEASYISGELIHPDGGFYTE